MIGVTLNLQRPHTLEENGLAFFDVQLAHVLSALLPVRPVPTLCPPSSPVKRI